MKLAAELFLMEAKNPQIIPKTLVNPLLGHSHAYHTSFTISQIKPCLDIIAFKSTFLPSVPPA